MNLGLSASQELATAYKQELTGLDGVELGVCASEFALTTVAKELKGTKIGLGAQNCFWETRGAYTGESAPASLEECGCRYVLLGHSERRQYLNESCRVVNLKLKQVLATSHLWPIVCVGESADVRQAGRHLAFVDGQIKRALVGLTPGVAGRLVLAYEPIWAIGTGLAATPDDAAEMHAAIRARLVKILGAALGVSTPILYGGSVNGVNAGAFLKTKHVDGLLVGGASLKIAEFKKIAKIRH